MVAMSDSKRTLTIKTDIVKRTLNELQAYKKEFVDNKTKLDEHRKINSDDVSQWEQVVNETAMMIPDSRDRLLVAAEDLEKYLEGEAVGDPALTEAADAMLGKAKAYMEVEM